MSSLAAGIKPLSKLIHMLIAEKTVKIKYLDFRVKILLFAFDSELSLRSFLLLLFDLLFSSLSNLLFIS